MAVTNSPRLGLPRWSEGTDLHPNRAEWDAQQGLLDDLVAIDVEVATYADRPSPKRGVYMWVVDEQRLYRATSTGWMTAAKIGGGGRGSQIVVGANSAAVEGTSAYAARADHTHSLPLATSAVDGAMAKADKAKLDTSTASAVASSIVTRDSGGKSAFDSVGVNKQPSLASDLTRKDYVDAGDAARFPFGLNAGTGSANNILEPGQYYQSSATPVTVANGYPFSGGAGSLLVYKFGSAASNYIIQEWTDWGNRRKFLRATNGGAGAWSEWRELAGSETATASADGLLSKADKAKLDGASVAAVIGSLVLRDSSGRAQFNTPSAGNDAANKTFTESTATAAASAAVNAIPLASSAVDGLMAKADKSKLDGAAATDTASRLVIRDSSGRARFKDPLAAQDASTKAYTDTTSAAAVAAIPTATSSVNGLMSSGDKTVLDAATASNTGSAIVKRWSSGSITVPSTPASGNEATSKYYVDAQDAKQVAAATSLGTTDLDTVSTDGNYVQTSNASATTANNYPAGGLYAGLLVVSSFSSFVFQTYTLYQAYDSRTFKRAKYNTGWSAWREIAFAELASSSADGLMSSGDKSKLDNAVSTDTASRLVLRDSAGRARFKNPSAAQDASTKAYTDSAASSAASAAVAGIPTATTGVNGLMLAVYADMLDYATYVESNSTLVRRSSTGIIDAYKFRGSAAPQDAKDLTRKDYVDSAIEAAVEKDTGWRDITSYATNLASGATVKVRRKGDEVTFLVNGNLNWPSSNGISYGRRNVDIISSSTSIAGFNGSQGGDNLVPLLSDTELYANGKANYNRASLSILSAIGGQLPTSGSKYLSFSLTRITKEAFPTTLPGTATSL